MDRNQLEEYIRNLPTELQEKARASRTPKELMELAKSSHEELDPDVLDMVTGGCDGTYGSDFACPKCGSYDIAEEQVDVDGITKIYCNCRFCTARWEKIS